MAGIGTAVSRSKRTVDSRRMIEDRAAPDGANPHAFLRKLRILPGNDRTSAFHSGKSDRNRPADTRTCVGRAGGPCGIDLRPGKYHAPQMASVSGCKESRARGKRKFQSENQAQESTSIDSQQVPRSPLHPMATPRRAACLTPRRAAVICRENPRTGFRPIATPAPAMSRRTWSARTRGCGGYQAPTLHSR